MDTARSRGMEMFSDRDIASVVSLIERESAAGRTALVAVDGPMAAGKSTLSAQVAQEIGDVSVVIGDDFYRPIGEADRLRLSLADSCEAYFEWRRLRDSVLVPLTNGARARYRRRDWVSDAPAEWREVAPGGAVVLDGVFSTRPELISYYDVTIFVDTPRAERLARALERGYDDVSWIEHWMAVEDWYLARFRPQDRANIVLSGSRTTA